ncbi:hypothetical protein AB0L80_42860 [Streptomyces sp. NPDC052069]|uniref:hypothetical protein n=1 Tax=Streptomyces sp. NPDC052069 TaxID=3154650 RepID=UPI003422D031
MTDPNRDLIRAVDRLTTQVRRIADGTAQDSFALAPPVVVGDDGGQKTGDDGPAWTLCICGDKPVTAQHPEPCPLSREPHASRLAEMHDALPLTTRKITSWCPVCPSGRHPLHPDQTCEERDAFAGRVQAFFERAAVPDMQHVTATMRENEQLRTELARINTRPDPHDDNVSLTVGEQLAMAAQLEEATAAIERVRAIRSSPARSEFNARTNAQDEGWDQALVAVRAALIGPIAEG